MSQRGISDEELKRLPIFPLRHAVLIPRNFLPLHIFEPRYREMTAHAIADDRPIAIARIRPEVPENAERPAVHDIIGVGRIVQFEQRDDGRYDLLLDGETRVRIIREHEQRNLYREVEAERLESTVDDLATTRNTMRLMSELVAALHGSKPAIAGVMWKYLHSRDVELSDTVDRLVGTLSLTSDEMQRLLEELVVDHRADFVLDKISVLVASSRGGSGNSPLN